MNGLLCDVIAVVSVVHLTCAGGGGYKFFPNLPAGEYRIDLRAALRCVRPTNNQMRFNYYVSKTTASTSVLKGNTSVGTPIDDSFDLSVNMAVKDSIGGWKDNALLYKSPRACTTLERLLGDAWRPVMDGFGMHNVSCPIPAGFYTATAVDMAMLSASNLPKQFFYGTYKFRFSYSKNNETYGCFISVIDIKRLWEND